MTDLRDRAIALYDAFTHDHRDRRAFMKEMVVLAGSVAAAEALVASIAASPAAAQQVKADDPRIEAARRSGTEAGAPATAYFAAPKASGRQRPTVLVIHENRGLNAHIEDVARRLALAGFRVIAPDFLAPQGGTPADEDRARTLIGSIDYDLALAQAKAFLAKARKQASGNGRTGAVGFCWGGAFVNRLAVADPALTAGVSYYGPAPDPAEAGKVRAALLLQLAGKDTRVNTTAIPWGDALRAAAKRATTHVYPGVDHAFNNDTSAARYDAAAATLAWERTIAFLRHELDAR
ncbi:carboxymethylenebutenolidase [Sphingomonas sp. Leaf407]|uniref:dienelactone hydrolase family protein n=1 Tax=unclassified Sphingomonas TaxID=196159 RepID=UPI00070061B8|nr:MULTISPECIES: dienelactone hydrolase family protein [unclassified Sphingomonas]KQN34163.1 carboxymethylenebutenolidase [Sphingomonas sp. Leaf42]KQT30606.1 carboxymethylenebutenolidase [Sphingomonas sp. Leaf407]